MLRYLRFCLLLTVFLLFLLPLQAAPRPVFDAVKLFGKDSAGVEKSLSSPVDVTRNYLGEFRDYRSKRGKVTVEYNGGKARSFQLWLDAPESDAIKALSLMGVSVKGQKQVQNTAYRKAWRGKFGHPSIKEVAATCTGMDMRPGRFNLVVVKDHN